MRVAVVIPAYNAEKTISDLIHDISNFINLDDIVVIDDGSKDNTYNLAKQAGVTILHHRVNRGKGAALATGFDYVVKNNYEFVITLDADRQHDYRSIPEFINKAKQSNAGVIIGSRMHDVGTMPFIRILTNEVTSLVVSIAARQRITDSQSGYRLFRTDVLRGIKLVTTRYDTESEILIKIGRRRLKIESIPIKSIYTGEGKSYINPFIDTYRFIRLIIRSVMW